MLAIVAACGPSAAKPDYPTLDPAPRGLPVDVPVAPAPDPAEFAPPPSNPSGEVVAVTWLPPRVGDRWVRKIEHDALYSSSWDTDSRRQRTQRNFEMGERVTQVDGLAIMQLEVTDADGREIVNLDDKLHPLTLVSGNYLVSARKDEPVTVSRAGSGFPIGDREREEIEGIYGAFLGGEIPMLVPIKIHPLRRGEVVELTDDEKAAGGGITVTQPVHMWLAGVADGAATYHFVTYDVEGTDTRGVKLTFVVELATGRMRGFTAVDARGDSSDTMQSTSRMVEETIFTY